MVEGLLDRGADIETQDADGSFCGLLEGYIIEQAPHRPLLAESTSSHVVVIALHQEISLFLAPACAILRSEPSPAIDQRSQLHLRAVITQKQWPETLLFLSCIGLHMYMLVSKLQCRFMVAQPC
jgi:hypothetical protein